jgi:VIT1/CCC1 family predicted Fe2+/Mn2+ transporter
MALGEYVSVSSQRDSERALIAKESAELRDMPEEEFEELVGLYRSRSPSPWERCSRFWRFCCHPPAGACR